MSTQDIHTFSNAAIHIVDDDLQVCDMIAYLFRDTGFHTQTYTSAESFYQAFDSSIPGCVLVDVCMPGMSGLTLQDRLNSASITIPVIFLTGHADVPMAVEAMAKGAVGFIQKPHRKHELLELVSLSVEWHASHLAEADKYAANVAKLQTLSEREQEILQHVVDGKPSKAIAADIGISQRTVEQHRANIMLKLEVDSLAQMIKLYIESREKPSIKTFRDSLRSRALRF